MISLEALIKIFAGVMSASRTFQLLKSKSIKDCESEPSATAAAHKTVKSELYGCLFCYPRLVSQGRNTAQLPPLPLAWQHLGEQAESWRQESLQLCQHELAEFGIPST